MVERFSEIRNKEVIHVCEGSRLGYVSDCCIELETGRVTAVVIPGPCRFLGLFGRDSDYVVPWFISLQSTSPSGVSIIIMPWPESV